MKGQIFIVVSILIAVSLLALSIGMNKIIVEESYVQDYFVNVRTEIKNTADNSLLNGEEYSDNLDDYIVFSEKILDKKGIKQEISYALSKKGLVIYIYLEKGEEYYRDEVIVPIGFYEFVGPTG